MNSYIYIEESFEGHSFPILTNGSRVWSTNHLCHHAVFTDCELQDGVNCALGPSRSIRHSGDFVIAGFVSTYFTVIL